MIDLNQSDDQKAREDALFAYMFGWRNGASSHFMPPESLEESSHMKSGYDDGRAAVKAAYTEASRHYEAELSPLRKGKIL